MMKSSIRCCGIAPRFRIHQRFWAVKYSTPTVLCRYWHRQASFAILHACVSSSSRFRCSIGSSPSFFKHLFIPLLKPNKSPPFLDSTVLSLVRNTDTYSIVDTVLVQRGYKRRMRHAACTRFSFEPNIRCVSEDSRF